MSVIRTYSFVINSINYLSLDNLTIDMYHKMESDIVALLRSKYKNISTMLSTCNLYVMGNTLVIQDKLGIAGNIDNVLRDFGLLVNMVEVDRCKVYVVQDSLIDTLTQLNSSCNMHNILDAVMTFDNITQELMQIAKPIQRIVNTPLDNIDKTNLAQLLNALKTKSQLMFFDKFSIKGVQNYNGSTLHKIISKENNKTQLIQLVDDVNAVIVELNAQAKRHFVKGMVSLLATRAKQMGYAVQSKKVGSKTQLVLMGV